MNIVKAIDEKERIAVLAHSNDEVSSLYSLLLQEELHVEYLLERGAFKLKNLSEIYFFDLKLRALCPGIECDEDNFALALQLTLTHFDGSKYLGLLQKVVNGFIRENAHYYMSLWESYLDEIRFEDFHSAARVVVSTMHKAKGKEFDTVVVLVRNRRIDDELLRLYYVAMTRARKRLVIITDDAGFVHRLPGSITIEHNDIMYDPPHTKTLIMTLKDVNLGFSGRQNFIDEELLAGMKATIGRYPGSERLHVMLKGEAIARLARGFDTLIKEILQNRYELVDIEVESVVIWQNLKTHEAIKHALCKFIFTKALP